MTTVQKNTSSLFDVFLRLRPPIVHDTDKFLEVDEPTTAHSTHITIQPPANDNRKRAVEKFAFTRVFDEFASQTDVLNGTSILPLVEGVLGPDGKAARDGLLATLGVTGSGKSHTILGSRSQRGLTQLALDVLFQSIGSKITQPQDAVHQMASSDVSEAQILTATQFLDAIYGDGDSRAVSRSQTPMPVSTTARVPYLAPMFRSPGICQLSIDADPPSFKAASGPTLVTRSLAKLRNYTSKDANGTSIYRSQTPIPTTARRGVPQSSSFPKSPSIDGLTVAVDENARYAIVVSMYEVYNDRIFDLLTSVKNGPRGPMKENKRRALLFKSTEYSPDRKVVAGLRKIVCGSLEEALLVLETGLIERRVAGTGSNAVSSRSHGFFCVEVKKCVKAAFGIWSSSTLTIVDLAGSERARTAKTAGATLAEAGKINESLMYLGQCMQMQSDNSLLPVSSGASHSGPGGIGPALVPFRQCKLTELLFSNTFNVRSHQGHTQQQQKAVMLVTADPQGDFNATSQILRYSALAREVTVPRIPSVSSTILASLPLAAPSTTSRPGTSAGTATAAPSVTPPSSHTTSDASTTALGEEILLLKARLDDETSRRRQAESSWAQASAQLEAVEAEVRAECWDAFEARLDAERQRWEAAWAEERERNDGHVDAKLAVLTRGLVLEDSDDKPNNGQDQEVEDLTRENEGLRERLRSWEQKAYMRTPSRKIKALKAPKWNVDEDEENLSP